MAATTVILTLASACGGDGGGTGPNADPHADFNVGTCTPTVACTFTDASTDPQGNNTISTRVWNFGDNTPDVPATGLTQDHTFQQAGTYQVKLTVTDNGGRSNSKTIAIPVGVGNNQPPVANFEPPVGCTAGTPCGFHSTSTDPDVGSSIPGAHWDFGDATSANNTAETPDATHTFANPGAYQVTLTVTDDKGAQSAPVAKQVTVTPATSQSCTTTLGTTVNCLLNITRTGQVKITLQSSQCELGDNKLTITAPVPQEAINNVCFQPDNTVYIVKDATGQPRTFQAGEQLGIRFRRGQPGPNDPPAGDPGIRVQGTYPNLVLNVDDGGNNAAPGEPDFNDAVLLIQQGP